MGTAAQIRRDAGSQSARIGCSARLLGCIIIQEVFETCLLCRRNASSRTPAAQDKMK